MRQSFILHVDTLTNVIFKIFRSFCEKYCLFYAGSMVGVDGCPTLGSTLGITDSYREPRVDVGVDGCPTLGSTPGSLSDYREPRVDEGVDGWVDGFGRILRPPD